MHRRQRAGSEPCQDCGRVSMCRSIAPCLLMDELRQHLAQISDGSSAQTLANVLAELWQLRSSFPDEPTVRQQLASAIRYQRHLPTHQVESGPAQIVHELKSLIVAGPNDAIIAGELAKALYDQPFRLRRRQPIEAAGTVLDELRQLAARYPAEEEPRHRLVMSLVNHHADALNARSNIASGILQEIRSLRKKNSEDKVIVAQLAMALFNCLLQLEPPSPDFFNVAEELYETARTHTEDIAIRGLLAKDIYLMHSAYLRLRSGALAESILHELSELKRRYDNDPTVLEELARVMCGQISYLISNAEQERASALIAGLREILESWPSEFDMPHDLVQLRGNVKSVFNSAFWQVIE